MKDFYCSENLLLYINIRPIFFVSTVFSFGQFGIKKNTSKLWTAVSWTTVRDGCDGGNPRWAEHTY